MSRKAQASLALAFVSILGITVGLGQGCSDSGTMGGLGGFSGGVQTNALRSVAPTIGLSSGNGGGYGGMVGNGGGYGGMVSVSEGQYRGHQSFQLPQQASPSSRRHHDDDLHLIGPGFNVYLRAGADSSCARYPQGWEDAGSRVAGELAINDSGHLAFFLPTSCSTPRVVGLNDISIVDFDTDIAVYGDKIHVKAEELPPPVDSLAETVVYCRSSIVLHEKTQFGTDVRIYRDGGALHGDLVTGKNVDGKAMRMVVRGFSVTDESAGSDLKFVTQGFTLDARKAVSLPSSGALSVLLDGEQLEIPLEKCWY